MGRLASQRQRNVSFRATRLTASEQHALSTKTHYRGNSTHKSRPGDFGLAPPCDPRPTKTLCDDAEVFRKADADALFDDAIAHGLCSEQTDSQGRPKRLWTVRAHDGQVFEFISANDATYHGYPVRRNDPQHDKVTAVWP